MRCQSEQQLEAAGGLDHTHIFFKVNPVSTLAGFAEHYKNRIYSTTFPTKVEILYPEGPLVITQPSHVLY